MAHPQIAAFARLAEGGVEPARRIEGQGTLLSRTMHGIAYDDIHDEIIVPQQFSQAILTFRGEADGEEAPIRKIQGPLTQLRRPDRLALDPVHNEIFVGDGRSVILVYPRQADGDVAPIRTIRGPDTQLDPWGGGASPIAVDPVHDALIVLAGQKILIFDRTADGNVKPRSVISGIQSGLGGGRMAVYPPLGRILVTGGSSREGGRFIGVWNVDDNGDVPPRWKLGADMLQSPRGVTVDAKNKTVIVTDKSLNAILTYSFPEIF